MPNTFQDDTMFVPFSTFSKILMKIVGLLVLINNITLYITKFYSIKYIYNSNDLNAFL